MGGHFLLQGIFPTQGLNQGLLHFREILYRLSHQRSPDIYKLSGGAEYHKYLNSLKSLSLKLMKLIHYFLLLSELFLTAFFPLTTRKKKQFLFFQIILICVYDLLYFIFVIFIFNWLMIALQYWFAFCHPWIWIHHRCTSPFVRTWTWSITSFYYHGLRIRFPFFVPGGWGWEEGLSQEPTNSPVVCEELHLQ